MNNRVQPHAGEPHSVSCKAADECHRLLCRLIESSSYRRTQFETLVKNRHRRFQKFVVLGNVVQWPDRIGVLPAVKQIIPYRVIGNRRTKRSWCSPLPRTVTFQSRLFPDTTWVLGGSLSKKRNGIAKCFVLNGPETSLNTIRERGPIRLAFSPGFRKHVLFSEYSKREKNAKKLRTKSRSPTSESMISFGFSHGFGFGLQLA